MATQYFSVIPYNDTDEHFRAWGSAISDALTAVGLVQTADTGQIDWDTVSKPTSSGTMQGYEIWRFDDGSLQTSNPTYIKIEYGSASQTNYPGLKVTVGHATDGAGTLTGETTTVFNIYVSSATTSSRDSYISGDTGRVSVLLFIGGGYSYSCGFYIERLKDDDGSANADGINFVRFSGYGSYSFGQQMLPASGAAYPSTAHTSAVCAAPPAGQGSYGTNIGLYPIYPNLGYCGNPDMGGLVYFTDDIDSDGSIIDVTMYGTTHSFITGGRVYVSTGVNGNSEDWAVAIRYE